VSERKPWIVAITGASGTAYAAAVLRGLAAAGEDIDLIVSRSARLTILDETGRSFRDQHWREDIESLAGPLGDRVRYWSATDFAAGPSSGSYRTKGMIVVPATSASIAGVAVGLSKDLIQRAAEVQLKERRRLIMVLRETPLTRSMLQRMIELVDEGAIILPANPGFYGGPTTVQDLVDFIAGKALDLMDVDHELLRRWSGEIGPGQEPDV
jgi:4-hydroxy-3-polyprenylbenzoate decarboxylase